MINTDQLLADLEAASPQARRQIEYYTNRCNKSPEHVSEYTKGFQSGFLLALIEVGNLEVNVGCRLVMAVDRMEIDHVVLDTMVSFFAGREQ